MALSKDGKVYAWGSNREGRLGVRSTKEVYMLPEVIPDNIFYNIIDENKMDKDNIDKDAYKEYDDCMKRIPMQNYMKDTEEVVYISVRFILIIVW